MQITGFYREKEFKDTEIGNERIEEHSNGGKSKDSIWHWQGSGRTYTMFFIANRYWKKNPIVFFVVDRKTSKGSTTSFLDQFRRKSFRSNFKKVESIKNSEKSLKMQEKANGVRR